MNKIIKVLLSSIFCLSTLVACSSSPYAKAEAQTLAIQGVPVYIEPDENTTQNDVDIFLKYLNKQPDYLISKCTKIYLQGENVYYSDAEDNEAGQSSVGYADPENYNVHLFINNTKSLDHMTEYDIMTTITHELWHLYDFSNGDGVNDLSDFDFLNLYNANPNSITEYGATDSAEFFAEAGAMYINNPEELKQKNMDVYNYFESLPKE